MIEKICVIYALKIDFTLLNKKNKLMILVPIGSTAKRIRKSIVYIALSINTYKTRSLNTNISGI